MTCFFSVRLLKRLARLLLAGICLALWPFTAHAATIVVDGTICTLPNAITAANTDTLVAGCLTPGNDADTLVLSPIVYTFTSSPFAGNGFNALPSITSTITISGNGAIIERSGSESFRFFDVAEITGFDVAGTTGNLTLEDVTLRYGNFLDGGAIHNRGTLALSNSQIVSNTASLGGGIFNRGTLDLSNSQIVSNTANNGGGIYNSGVTITATLTDSQLSSNTAAEDGGGIFNRGTLALSNSQILSNTASDEGGGIFNYVNGSTATLTDSQIISNTAADGGGIYNDLNSTASLIDSQIIANTAADDGGGLHNSAGTATFTGTDIVANLAGSVGGGLYTDGGVISLSQSRLLDNRALNGSALQQSDDEGFSSIEQSCIVGNNATAVNNDFGAPIEARNNWWGAPDGPSGAGPGAGDSVSSDVNFTPFLSSQILDCSPQATSSEIYLPRLRR